VSGRGGLRGRLRKEVSWGRAPPPKGGEKAMSDRPAAGKLLKGYRGAPACDEASVLKALIALGQLAHDLGDELESIDINPFVALPAGDGAVALDALVVLRGQ